MSLPSEAATDETIGVVPILSLLMALYPPLVRALGLQLVQLLGCHQDGAWL